MKLDENQISEVKKWIADGADIARVQSLLSEKFAISMRYMDVRFLVDDLDIAVSDKPEPVQEKKQEQTENPDAFADAAAEFNSEPTASAMPEDAPIDDANNGEAPQSDVSVSLSPIQRPGAIASGDVIFSDGGKAEWVLDQSGRLGLIPATQGYNPPAQDMQPFQKKLMQLLGQM